MSLFCVHRTSLDFWRNFDKRDMASHLISHTLYKVEQMKTSRAHFVVHIGQKPILDDPIFCCGSITVKSRVEARVTIQKIKSLGVLQTETCH